MTLKPWLRQNITGGLSGNTKWNVVLQEGVISRNEAEENYHNLPKEEQGKDKEPLECMLELLKLYDGLRIYRLNEKKRGY